jgi:hypothetical protein
MPDSGEMPIRRTARFLCVLACGVALPAALPAAASAARTGTIAGKIIYANYGALTVQSGGRQMGRVNAMIRTANKISRKVYPYVYAGGHAQAGVASVGMRGPGYNGRRKGFDCSGSVAAVLAGGGLWPAGSGVPSDAGVVAQLLHEHLIARGAGHAPREVNLYDDWGYHIFMSINGRFFGTSDGGGGNPKGGPTWLYDGAPDTHSRHYKAYHFLPRVLRNKTSYGQSFAFQTYYRPNLMEGAVLGEKVRVHYRETRTGAMNATSVDFLNPHTMTGNVTSVAGDDSDMSIQTPGGQAYSFDTSTERGILSGVQPGDTVQVTYSQASKRLIPHAVKVLSAPNPEPTSPTGPGGG